LRIAIGLGILALAIAPRAASGQHVVFDDKIDFTRLQTFAIQPGRATTTRPELNNRLILDSAGDAIRAQFAGKRLKEAATDAADVLVSFSIGQDRPNGPSVTFDEGVIVVQVTRRDPRALIWHGTYRDPQSSPAKLAERVPAYIKKLLAGYPPKRK
jgi:hypothetical protein